MRRHRKGKPQVHTAGIALDGRVDELLHFRKGDDFIELAIDLGLSHPQNSAVKEYVFPPAQLAVKARADFQQ